MVWIVYAVSINIIGGINCDTVLYPPSGTDPQMCCWAPSTTQTTLTCGTYMEYMWYGGTKLLIAPFPSYRGRIWLNDYRCHTNLLSHRINISVDHISLTVCRGVGCIFFEMACGRPMFPGSNTEEELLLQWKVLLLWMPLCAMHVYSYRH